MSKEREVVLVAELKQNSSSAEQCTENPNVAKRCNARNMMGWEMRE